MHDSEIKEIADKLIRNSDSKEAYFGIAEHSNDQFYIKANKDGLMLFAAEILYASAVDNNSRIWGIHREWIDVNILELAYIQLIDQRIETLTSASATSKIIQ